MFKHDSLNELIMKGTHCLLFQILYDLVVTAYTLFELPSKEARFNTLLNLWQKTRHYLVIVELGTNAGFKVWKCSKICG